MIEGGGFPLIDAMALLAVPLNLLMETVLGFSVTTGAIITNVHFNQRMRKRLTMVLCQFWVDMIAMTGNTIFFE